MVTMCSASSAIAKSPKPMYSSKPAVKATTLWSLGAVTTTRHTEKASNVVTPPPNGAVVVEDGDGLAFVEECEERRKQEAGEPLGEEPKLRERLEVVANNVANVNTAGFKQTRIAFQDFLVKEGPDGITDKGFSAMALTQTDLTAGGLQPTGNPLDVALSGPGFFMVRGPDGDTLTRNGSFRISADGTLVNANGMTVLGGRHLGQPGLWRAQRRARLQGL